ncbi:unnamed protein product, partial [Porites evermanni]
VAYLYKCWVSRTDCSICHYDSTAEPYLKCGWCKADTNKCVVQEACNEVGGFWIPYSLPCRTKPIITKVWPLAGPISGGTEVEIYGYDLGKSFFDINNTVTVAGYSCVTNPDKYQPSKRVFCNTTASTGPVSGPVTVTVNNLKGQSAKQFHYQINGFLAGVVGLLYTVNCHPRRPRDGQLGQEKRLQKFSRTEVIITFDGFTPVGPSGSFIFVPDPTITAIEPNKVYFGGGLELRVTGTNLDAVQNAEILFKYPSENGALSNTTVQGCKPESSSWMTCRSPKVPNLAGNVTKVTAVFIMDALNVQSNLTVAIIPDPYFVPFAEVRQLKEASLILEGRNLENALKTQMFVTVGELPCKITGVDKEQLVCLAPTEESHSSKPPNGLYAVKVVVGNLHFTVGMLECNLKYYENENFF